MSGSSDRQIGLVGAIAIGVGGMVGGGIFAVLGLAVHLARGGTPAAFALAGVVALLTAYSYARLSVALPSQGGTVIFLDRAFGPGLLTGGLNVLLWISYVVMLALYAYAFGGYGAAFLPEALQGPGKHVLITAVVLAMTALNFASANLVAEAEDWIVGLKLAILLFFVAVGAWGIDGARLAPPVWSPPMQLAAGGMIIFVAYEGFELIANAAGEVRDPDKTLPRAFFGAVGLVIALYVAVAAVAVGNLSLGKIADAQDYALAEAARPFLGQTGFVLIGIAALLSTASAINATLYGAARLSYSIAREGELPAALEDKVWSRPIEGLLITTVLTLLVANFFDLSRLSTMGSAGFLLIFAAVNSANVVLAAETGSRRWLSAAGGATCLAALGALIWHSVTVSPGDLWVLAAMVGLAFAIEGGYRLATGRELRVSGTRNRSAPTTSGSRTKS